MSMIERLNLKAKFMNAARRLVALRHAVGKPAAAPKFDQAAFDATLEELVDANNMFVASSQPLQAGTHPWIMPQPPVQQQSTAQPAATQQAVHAPLMPPTSPVNPPVAQPQSQPASASPIVPPQQPAESVDELQRIAALWKSYGFKQVDRTKDTVHVHHDDRIVEITAKKISLPQEFAANDLMHASMQHMKSQWNASFDVHGTPEFKLRSWAYAQAYGLNVTNYTPSAEELTGALELAEYIKQEVASRAQAPVAATTAPAATAATAAAVAAPTPVTQPVQTAPIMQTGAQIKNQQAPSKIVDPIATFLNGIKDPERKAVAAERIKAMQAQRYPLVPFHDPAHGSNEAFDKHIAGLSAGEREAFLKENRKMLAKAAEAIADMVASEMWREDEAKKAAPKPNNEVLSAISDVPTSPKPTGIAGTLRLIKPGARKPQHGMPPFMKSRPTGANNPDAVDLLLAKITDPKKKKDIQKLISSIEAEPLVPYPTEPYHFGMGTNPAYLEKWHQMTAEQRKAESADSEKAYRAFRLKIVDRLTAVLMHKTTMGVNASTDSVTKAYTAFEMNGLYQGLNMVPKEHKAPVVAKVSAKTKSKTNGHDVVQGPTRPQQQPELDAGEDHTLN